MNAMQIRLLDGNKFEKPTFPQLDQNSMPLFISQWMFFRVSSLTESWPFGPNRAAIAAAMY